MGLNCLCLALFHRAFSCASWLLAQPFAALLLTQVTKLKETVLHIAVGAMDRVDASSDSLCKSIVYSILQGSKTVFDIRSIENITAIEKAIQLQRSWFISSVTQYASAVLIDSIFQRSFDPESPLNLFSNPNSVDRNNNPVLYIAVCLRDAAAVRYLVAAGANVNRFAPDGWSPLLAASSLGDCSICDTLLQSSADLHATLKIGYNCTPLQLAAAGGRSDIITRLLSFGALIDARNDLGLNAVHLALLHGHRETAFTLISSAKASGKSSSVIVELLRTPQPSLLHRLICSDLPEATMIKCVNMLLTLGCNVDDKDGEGRSPVQAALAENLPLVAAVLGTHAKNIGGDNRAALFAAADSCNSLVLSQLLPLCSDLNCREFFDHGRPLLHALVRSSGSGGQNAPEAIIEFIRMMCSNPQCNIDIADDHGCTPLHVAAAIGSDSCLAVLLESGADCDATSLSSSALCTALHSGHFDCAYRLLQFGANLMNPLGPHGAFSCVVAAVCSGVSTVVNRVIEHTKLQHCHSLRQTCEFQVALDGATLPLLWLEHSKASDEETLEVLKTLILGGSDVLQCNYASVAPYQVANARSFFQTARFISNIAQSRLLSVVTNPSPSLQVRLEISNCIAGGARLDIADKSGLLPIHICASIGSAAALEALASSPALQQSSALNAVDANGHNAMCHAASKGRSDLLPILDRLKVSHSSSCGCSALAHAVIMQKIECVRVFGTLQSSRDAAAITVRNPSLGVDVLQLACVLADVDIIRVMMESPSMLSSIEKADYDGVGCIVHYLASLHHHSQQDTRSSGSSAETTPSLTMTLAKTLAQTGAAFLRRNSQVQQFM
jgi:ankyrin repeat protein